MIHGMQYQSMVLWVRTQIGFVQNRIEDAQPGLAITISLFTKIVAQTQKALRGDRGGGTVDRFELVEWIRTFCLPVAKIVELRRRGVPVGNSIGGTGMIDIKIASCLCCFQEWGSDALV